MKALFILLSILPWQNLLQEAKQHYMKYENDSCAMKVASVREYCLSHPNEEGVLEMSAEVENIFGALAQVEGLRDSSAVHYQNAYNYAMRLKDRSKSPTYCINLADVLRQNGRAPEAAQWLRRALSLSDSLAIHELDCAINTQLGQIYSDLRNFPVAESYFDAAGKCCESGSFDEYFLANARGNACFFNEEYTRAVQYFKKAIELALPMNNVFRVRIPELNVGECYLSLHQLDSANHYIDKAYDFWSQEQYCDESILIAIRGMKAGLALERGNVKEAGKWLECGEAGSGASPIYTDAFNRHMMEISVLKQDWKSAYEYSRKLMAYTDSLSRNTLESNFVEAEMRYSRDTTILHQQLRIAGQNAKISRLNVWILISILFLISCTYTIWRIQSERKKEQKRTEDIINQLKLENLKITGNTTKISVEEARGDRFVTTGDMVLFSYQPDTRRWSVLLKDGTNATMKRNFRAEKILELNPSYTKLNPGTIVNMDYIKSIGLKDQNCTLIEPFNHIQLYFSRRAKKKTSAIKL